MGRITLDLGLCGATVVLFHIISVVYLWLGRTILDCNKCHAWTCGSQFSNPMVDSRVSGGFGLINPTSIAR